MVGWLSYLLCRFTALVCRRFLSGGLAGYPQNVLMARIPGSSRVLLAWSTARTPLAFVNLALPLADARRRGQHIRKSGCPVQLRRDNK